MAAVDRFDHEFVDSIPEDLDEGVLYVSMSYATVIHLCACGCGNQAVTPLDPTDYKLTYDGESISLSPSVGNWQFPCRSHYIIKCSKVYWADDWTDQQITAGRARDRRVTALAFSDTDRQLVVGETPAQPFGSPQTANDRGSRQGFRAHLRDALRRARRR